MCDGKETLIFSEERRKNGPVEMTVFFFFFGVPVVGKGIKEIGMIITGNVA